MNAPVPSPVPPPAPPPPKPYFCWACGTNHTRLDICIPRSE